VRLCGPSNMLLGPLLEGERLLLMHCDRKCSIGQPLLVDDDIILIKYWFEVSREVQFERLEKRIEDPRKHWKLSPMDLDAQELWDKYSEAKDRMFLATDSKHAPWFVVNSDNKKSARLNCISHLLSQIPYERIPFKKPKIKKAKKNKYTPIEYGYTVVSEKF
jgi:hypothetical protein